MTAAPEQEKPRQKRTRTWSRSKRQDWAVIRAAWQSGERSCDIAKRLGTIRQETINTKAHKERWERSTTPVSQIAKSIASNLLPAAVEREVKQAVTEEVQRSSYTIPQVIRSQIEDHFKAILFTSTKLHTSIDDNLRRRIADPRKILSLTNALMNIDTLKRRTFGLDGPDGQRVSAGLFASIATPTCPVVDAEVVQEEPASTSEAKALSAAIAS